ATTVFVGSEDNHLYAVNAITGEEIWNISTGGKVTSSPALADGIVYIGSDDGNLYAIE
ncbi:MAG: PQQ-binding-like beta-propeller repeat protein, partial [Chloroflexota bacterium]